MHKQAMKLSVSKLQGKGFYPVLLLFSSLMKKTSRVNKRQALCLLLGLNKMDRSPSLIESQ